MERDSKSKGGPQHTAELAPDNALARGAQPGFEHPRSGLSQLPAALPSSTAPCVSQRHYTTLMTQALFQPFVLVLLALLLSQSYTTHQNPVPKRYSLHLHHGAGSQMLRSLTGAVLELCHAPSPAHKQSGQAGKKRPPSIWMWTGAHPIQKGTGWKFCAAPWGERL